MWHYNETSEFVRCCENLKLSEKILEAIESWTKEVGRVSTNRQKCYFCSPNNKFEIWIARMPDADTNTGSSGGFRLIYFFNLTEGAIHVDRIERRRNLGGKNERKKDQQKSNNYLEELKEYLIKELEDEK